MGLNFANSEAHWSYSGFMHFRERLAEEIGVDLDEMDGFGDGDKPWNTVKDPIKYLLNHSDCDGTIGWKRCGVVGPRLAELISGWDDNDYDKEQGLLLAVAMDECYAKKKSLVFC